MPYPPSYDPALVVLSLVVATLAAYTTVTLISRIGEVEGRDAYRAWLTTSAMAMGVGI